MVEVGTLNNNAKETKQTAFKLLNTLKGKSFAEIHNIISEMYSEISRRSNNTILT